MENRIGKYETARTRHESSQVARAIRRRIGMGCTVYSVWCKAFSVQCTMLGVDVGIGIGIALALGIVIGIVMGIGVRRW